MVIKNRDKLDKLAQALLEKEIVTGDELRALFGMTKEPVTA